MKRIPISTLIMGVLCLILAVGWWYSAQTNRVAQGHNDAQSSVPKGVTSADNIDAFQKTSSPDSAVTEPPNPGFEGLSGVAITEQAANGQKPLNGSIAVSTAVDQFDAKSRPRRRTHLAVPAQTKAPSSVGPEIYGPESAVRGVEAVLVSNIAADPSEVSFKAPAPTNDITPLGPNPVSNLTTVGEKAEHLQRLALDQQGNAATPLHAAFLAETELALKEEILVISSTIPYSDAVRNLYRTALQSFQDQGIRLQAMNQISQRDPVLLRPLASDSDPVIRIQAQDYLGMKPDIKE
jgi:hypothetical protein